MTIQRGEAAGSSSEAMLSMGEVLRLLGQALQGVQSEGHHGGHWLLLAETIEYLAVIERGDPDSHPADTLTQNRGILSSNLAREKRRRGATGVILELRDLREQLDQWPGEDLNEVHGAP